MSAPQSKAQKVNAFTKRSAGGNPAGVVLRAETLSKTQRQALATAAGYSETVFVEGRGNDLKLEYFTPARQIDICGHATVGAFSLLRDRRLISLGNHSFRSVIGTHRVMVTKDSVGLWQKGIYDKLLGTRATTQTIAQSLETQPRAFASPLRLANNGSPFLLVEVADRASLKMLRPNLEQVRALSERLNIVGYYVYFKNSKGQVEARMFAPHYGIAEESATGMAAGALALSLYRRTGQKHFEILQGHLMPIPSPSKLEAEVFGPHEVLVSGQAV